MADEPELRVSDDDRERAASEIREHYAQGRLDAEELDERLHRAYAARTAGELAAVRADLPSPGPAPAPTAHVERRAELTRELLQQTGAGLVPFLVCTAIWLFSGADSDFWPAWLLLIAAVPLLRNGWRLYGPSPQLDRVAEELARPRGPAGPPRLSPPPPPSREAAEGRPPTLDPPTGS